MQVSTHNTEFEPIRYDLEAMPLALQASSTSLSGLFREGRASLDDDLLDAVAMSGGIEHTTGWLNLDMLSAAQSVHDYSAGKQGQPVALMETWSLQDRPTRTHGYVGVLDDSEKLVGAYDAGPVKGQRVGGIKTQGAVHDMSISLAQGGPRVDICQSVPRATVIPFADLSTDLTLGVLRTSVPYTKRQDVLAGEDIIPWIQETFQDRIEQYVVFFGIASALKGSHASHYIMKPPYVGMLQAEQNTMREMSASLQDTRHTVDYYEQRIADAKERGAEQLQKLQAAAGELAFRIPHSADSTRRLMTEPIVDRQDIQGRLQAAERGLQNLTEIIENPES
jgi:hypothetical protein